MSELDIEKLKQTRDRARELEAGDRERGDVVARQVWLYVDEAEAIIAALEDRERLRAIVERVDRIVERMYLPMEFAGFQAELVRALEGRDG